MPWNQVMSKFASGDLQSSSGQTITSSKQAMAIKLSEKKKSQGNTEYKATNMSKALKSRGMK